jgi:8-oxo-dGTP pyrophosphatase MutT (NUDIX family)
MNADLVEFITRHTPIDEEQVSWRDGKMPLHIISYLSDALPPVEYVTSVRAIVLRDASVLVLKNVHSKHVMPGGRREAHESFEQTLHREVLEEAGWTITRTEVLGFRHVHHLAPKPLDYAYPYPDFVWLIYAADAGEYRPDARMLDDYEEEANFRPFNEVQTFGLTQAEHLYLDAARKRRAP